MNYFGAYLVLVINNAIYTNIIINSSLETGEKAEELLTSHKIFFDLVSVLTARIDEIQDEMAGNHC